MSRRERPQLVLSAQGQPRYFSSGVQDVAVRNILMFKLNLFGEPFLNQSNRSIDQDRLGTMIGNVEKRDDAFSVGPYLHAGHRGQHTVGLV